MPEECSFILTTSTASVCIFDPDCLRHRVKDAPDWWSDYSEEIIELNRGNAMIVGVGSDGSFNTLIGRVPHEDVRSVSALVQCRSGQFFVGPGEEISGGGFEPRTLTNRTGIFLNLAPSAYQVTVAKLSSRKIAISIELKDGAARNRLRDQLLLLE